MVHRAVPLRINVGVATLAGVGLHEVLRGDVDIVFGLSGAGEEFAGCAIPFAVHGVRRHQWVDNAIGPRVAPADFAHEPESRGDGKSNEDKRGKTESLRGKGLPQPAFRMEPVRHKQYHADNAKNDVGVQPIPEMMRSSNLDQSDAEKGSGSQENPTQASNRGSRPN